MLYSAAMKTHLKPLEQTYEAKTRLQMLDALIADHLDRMFDEEEIGKVAELAHLCAGTDDLLRQIAKMAYDSNIDSAEDEYEPESHRRVYTLTAGKLKDAINECADRVQEIQEAKWAELEKLEMPNSETSPVQGNSPQNKSTHESLS